MRWVVGLLLVAAAALKTVQLFIEPMAALEFSLARWLGPWQVTFELTLGLFALSGIYWRWMRWIALLAFCGFAGYSLNQSLSGATSCGCFGPVQVHPWWIFILDSVIVVGLAFSFLKQRKAFMHARAGETNSAFRWPPQPQLAAVSAAFAVVIGAILVRYVDHRSAAADDLSAPAGGFVVLDPESWVGKELPIAEFIDLDLSSGEWTVLLHRHDCPMCHEVLPHYEALALSGKRVALVEVPPYGEPFGSDTAWTQGWLRDERDWFVQTPMELQLRDGVVMAVTADGR